MTWRIVYLLLFLSFGFSGRTQELLFSNISNEMQLPSQECYQILQDKKGYIWFSTDNGLCRYNNSKITVFDAQNGLPEKGVYAMEEDNTGKIWLATAENRILFLDGGPRLKEAAFSKAYQKTSPDWAHPTPYALDVSDPETIYISNYTNGASIQIRNNRITKIKKADANPGLAFTKKKGHPFLRLLYELPYVSVIELISGDRSKKILLPKSVWSAHPRFLTHLSGRTDFISIHDHLLRINPDLSYSIYSFPDRILSLYTDKSGGLWVGTVNNGVFYYPDVSTMEPGHHSLRNYSVTGICEDNERGIWCTTLEKGIFYSKNKHLVSYSSTPGLDRTLTLLKFYDQSIYASSSAKEIFRFTSNKEEKFPILNEKKRAFSDLYHEGNSWLLIGKELMIRTNNQFHAPEKLSQELYGDVASYELACNNEGRLMSIMYSTLFELFEKKQPKMIATALPFVSKTILFKNRNTLFLGGNQGIHTLNIRDLSYKKLPQIPEHVVKIMRASSGRIWVITKEDGIFWIDGNKITHANKQLSFKPAILYDVAEDPNGGIWIGSNKGLYHLEQTKRGYKTSLYTISHGLSSSDVYKVAADNQKIWFSTFEGLFSLPLSVSTINQVGPVIHLQQVSVRDKVIPHDDHTFQFPYDQNDFRFTFDILTFKNGTNTRLKYHLKQDGESRMMEQQGNEILLDNLEPGNYQLMVYGINNDGVKSTRPEVFLIRIEAPFWATWWFILLISALMVLIVLLITRTIIRSIRKKEEAKTQVNKLLAEYQITALQAQMNPHFIFNAINTIQGYILEKNEEEAYNYLAKFSKLIRTVLHHSQEKVLLLEHEIEVLNLYIELEKLRFDNCFDYELILSDEIDPHDIHLPGMILQPYVENAIWHGIVNLRESRRGKLTLSMDRTDKLLLVCIEDNGIGREKAMSFHKDKRHKSVGMQLTGERLKAMNQLHGYETAQVTITDLFDPNGEAAGTKVEVRIPITSEL